MMPADNRVPRVLIADDDEINLLLMRETLESGGFEVVAAGDGAEALRLAITCVMRGSSARVSRSICSSRRTLSRSSSVSTGSTGR